MRYTLMHKEQPVLEMILDEITGGISEIAKLHAPEHVPVGISVEGVSVDRADMNRWWQSRSIPAKRSGIRDAWEHLGSTIPQTLLSRCLGLSLSDQYWIKPENRKLSWSEINFFENTFSKDVGNILFGMHIGEETVDLLSPDITTDGLLRKRWKIIDGTRCIIKGGSAPFYQEPLNEVFASKLMERLRVMRVPYHLSWIDGLPYSVCPDFVTASTELISAHHISRVLRRDPETPKYQHFLNCCEALEIPDVQPQLDKMLTVDFLLSNNDRHMGNFGALRDADTLKWIGLAPVYDCGTSLWHNHLLRSRTPEIDCPGKPFSNRQSDQIRLVQTFDWLEHATLEGAAADLNQVLIAAPRFIDDERRAVLCDMFQARIELLHKIALGMDTNTPTQTMNY